MSSSHSRLGRAIAIINPSAGRGRAARAWPEIRAALHRAGLPLEEVTTRTPQETMDVAAGAASDGYSILVSVGGDGTTHWAVNGLMHSRVSPPPALAIIPEGTANDFARCLKIPPNPGAAAQVVLDGTRRRVDIGQANDRYFATISGVGFDAEVADLVNHWPRWLRGAAVYAAGILRTLATYRPVPARIVVDGQEQRLKLFLLAAANTNWYGGGFYMAPHARIDDGMLAIVYAIDLTKLETLAVLPKVFSGRHLGHPKVAHTTAQHVRVESTTPLAIHADGEIVGRVPVTFRIVSQALEVIVPKTD